MASLARNTVAQDPNSIVVYSGRSENLVDALIQQFSQATGIDVDVRYGSTSEMAAMILEEGANSPADVFFSQDAGALGALADENILTTLGESTLALVEQRFRSDVGNWVGVSGRARVAVFNSECWRKLTCRHQSRISRTLPGKARSRGRRRTVLSSRSSPPFG